MALKLVGIALRRSADIRQGEGVPSVDASEDASGGGKGEQAEAGKGGGGGKAGAAPAHVFFRVVLYNGLEETVSTLHLVDLEGGWEEKPAGKAAARKPAGKGGGKASSAASARPSAASRAWNSFDAMIVGLASASQSAGSPFPCSGGDGSRPGGCTLSGDCTCDACSGAASLGPSNGNAGGDGDGHKNSEPAAVEETTTAADVAPPPPPRPPPPHPVYGSPKGKSFGGGGGGRLVEALRPLIAGNARTWLVVSVGGEGKGGPGAAWRVLDVARRATDIATTCIRLRGVTLADLRLRSPNDVLAGDGCCPRSSSPQYGANGRDDAREAASTLRVHSDTSSAIPFAEVELGRPLVVSPCGGGGGGGGGSSGGGATITAEQLPSVVNGGDYESLNTALGGGGEEGPGCVDAFLEGFHRGGGVKPGGSSSGSVKPDDRLKLADSSRRVGLSDTGSDHTGTPRGCGSPSDSSAAASDPSSVAAAAALSDLNLLLGEQGSSHMGPPPRRTGGRAATSARTSSRLRPRETSDASIISAGQPSSFPAGRAVADSAMEGVEPEGRGGDAVAASSTAVARAKANIDRMMSSLLEDVLPESKKKSAVVALEKGGPRERGTAAVSPRRCLPETREPPPPAACDGAVARKCPSSAPPLLPPPPPPQVRPPSSPPLPSAIKTSTPPRGEPEPGSEGGGDNAVFLTPIEVLMHASAGGERWQGVAGCTRQTQCSGRPTKELERSRSAGSTAIVAGHPAGTVRVRGEAPSKTRRRRRNSAGSIDRRTGPPEAQKGDRYVPATPKRESALPSSPAATAAKNGDSENRVRKSGGCEEDTGAASRTSSRGASLEGTARDARPRSTEREAMKPGTTEAESERLANAAGGKGEENVDALAHRNHAALLRVIGEQEERRKQMERRFEAKECDWLERVTALEAQREGLRAEAVEMRGRLRRAESSSSSAEVFER
ncbi:unnamed protein product [Laminaria digitata]